MQPHTNIKLQNYCLAIRHQLGFRMFAMANESVKFCAGGELDPFQQMHTAALAEEMGRDLVYCAWRKLSASTPISIAVVFREELLVDFVDGCTLWTADEEAPLILLNERRGEHFLRGVRGMLERRSGLPARGLAAGKRLALNRVRRAASAMDDTMLENNVTVPHGGRWADYRPGREGTIVRIV